MFVIITAKSKQGKTNTLLRLAEDETRKTIFISKFSTSKNCKNELIMDKGDFTLRNGMTKYLALGYEKFYIDDVGSFEWDVNELDEFNTPQQRIAKCLYWLEKAGFLRRGVCGG